jgi:hypothetical protein
MPVTIARSTRAKLLRITARDLHPPLRDPFKPLTVMLAAATVLRPPSGRFWDTDSDSECEDLGDADGLRSAVSSCVRLQGHASQPDHASQDHASQPDLASHRLIYLETAKASKPQSLRPYCRRLLRVRRRQFFQDAADDW